MTQSERMNSGRRLSGAEVWDAALQILGQAGLEAHLRADEIGCFGVARIDALRDNRVVLRSAGKGFGADAALASAAGEIIEHYYLDGAAVSIGETNLMNLDSIASQPRLAGWKALDDLCDTNNADTRVSCWTYSAVDESATVFVPVELVSLGVSATAGDLNLNRARRTVTSNGWAVGSSASESLNHGALELHERHGLSCALHSELGLHDGSQIDVRGSIGEIDGRLIDEVEKIVGRPIRVTGFKNQNVYSVVAVSEHKHLDQRGKRFIGSGASTMGVSAMNRALTEIVQDYWVTTTEDLWPTRLRSRDRLARFPRLMSLYDLGPTDKTWVTDPYFAQSSSRPVPSAGLLTKVWPASQGLCVSHTLQPTGSVFFLVTTGMPLPLEA